MGWLCEVSTNELCIEVQKIIYIHVFLNGGAHFPFFLQPIAWNVDVVRSYVALWRTMPTEKTLAMLET
jgi:hypothetical protein